MIFVFWFSLLVLLYTYFGYPAYISIRAKCFATKIRKDPLFQPAVSVIMSAYNESYYIENKIGELLRADYPKDKIEILAGSDGSTDETATILRNLQDKGVKAFIFEKRRGKPSVLNDLVSHAKGEILVFCDVRQSVENDAIAQLAANFADEMVGCVSGELIFDGDTGASGVSEGVGLYWEYEKFIRQGESAVHSMAGATGALYAIRCKLYSPLPADTILDDVYTPLSVARGGYRCIVDAAARAHDKIAMVADQEYQRKVRTLAGNYQIFAMFKDLLVPFRNRIFLPLVSHKVLRVLAPFFMIALFIGNIVIAEHGRYGAILMAQIAFYALAVAGGITSARKPLNLPAKAASAADMFCFLNFAALAGLYRFLFGKQRVAWDKRS